MSRAPDPDHPEEPDHEIIPSPEVLELERPAAAEDAADAGDDLSPKERKALELLKRTFAHRNEQADADAKRRLEDEAFLIRMAAQRLTGLSLLSSPKDAKVLVVHHLTEFFAALPMPPGLDAHLRAALRREALTMLLKLGPQDDIERMLLMQLIASHMASMTCFARMSAPGTSPELAAQAMGLAQKMSRLFLDIERAFRQRRGQIGHPGPPSPRHDPKLHAEMILDFLKDEGIEFDDDDAPA
ncbi:hypothetical protein [Silicimonas sp. MF1-12-2]|uniref:hypothetical protein n=1 Tax=Silicimonas sp. MF1-12-2 TaxID=3384793 RepID=UPI0039B49C66